MVEPDRLFFSLVEQRKIDLAVGNKQRRAVRAIDYFHVEELTIEISQLLRIRGKQRYVTNRHRPVRVRRIEAPGIKPDVVAVRIAQLVIDAGG